MKPSPEMITPLATMGEVFGIQGTSCNVRRVLPNEMSKSTLLHNVTRGLFKYAEQYQNDTRLMVAEIPYQINDILNKRELNNCVFGIVFDNEEPVGIIFEYNGRGAISRQHCLLPGDIARQFLIQKRDTLSPLNKILAFAVDGREFTEDDILALQTNEWRLKPTTVHKDKPAEIVTRVMLTIDDLPKNIHYPDFDLAQIPYVEQLFSHTEDLKFNIRKIPTEHLTIARQLAMANQIHGSFNPEYIRLNQYPYYGAYIVDDKDILLIAMGGYDSIMKNRRLNDVKIPDFAIATNLVVAEAFRGYGIGERLRYMTHTNYFKHNPKGMIVADLVTPEAVNLYTKKFKAHIIKTMLWGELERN